MDRNNLLSTQEVAAILNVSVSTVRRLSNDGTLPCYRIGKAGYRKFDYQAVENLRQEYYGVQGDSAPSANNSEGSSIVKKRLDNIPAESHPAHYLMHKYWGRKAHNVVSEYIQFYTKEGDTILEPFMGSGVTVVEALKLGRNVIGVDINPVSVFIVRNTISRVDLSAFTKRYNEIFAEVMNQYGSLYSTKCPICGANSHIETAVWENDQLVRIKGVCPEHKVFITDATALDIQQYDRCKELKEKLVSEGQISYPTDPIMKYVKRSGRERIDELFSDRALVILSTLRNHILETEDVEVKNLLMFCFTSMLSNVSRMLPGDKEKSTYKSGWVISKFWTPTIHTERNIFHCLQLRYNAILKGKRELSNLDPSLAVLQTGDACNLTNIEDNSIDYIFTDPPYGESIAYLALSHFWNSWLSENVDYADEIIIDPYRNKGYEDYSQRTAQAYKELFRVLKNNHYMSFTFHNRDMNVWKAILDACRNAGFVLESITFQEQAVNSGTQGINRNNTLTGDFVYNFKKDTSVDRQIEKLTIDAKSFIKDCINEFITENDGATPSKLYEYIIPIIVENNAYTDDEGNAVNIESILKKDYEYVPSDTDGKNKIGSAYKWIIKSN